MITTAWPTNSKCPNGIEVQLKKPENNLELYYDKTTDDTSNEATNEESDRTTHKMPNNTADKEFSYIIPAHLDVWTG
jgi:hypothetical protein